MTFSDKILLLQSIIQAVTLIVIIWYTYETSIIRIETKRQSTLNPSSKLWDRQNDLDRLVLVNPKVARLFVEMANRKTAYFYAPAEEVPRNEEYFQLKSFVYMQLNFFEEIYTTTSNSDGIAKQFEREDWHIFIFQYMRHSLLKEVFFKEKERAYTGEFVRFLSENYSKWDGEADSDLF